MEGGNTEDLPNDDAESPIASSISTPMSEAESDSDDPSYCRGNMTRITIIDKNGKRKTYRVHQRLLSEKSPYFAALLNFREGKEKHVTLNNIDHKAFKQLLQWLYEGQFRSNVSRNKKNLNIFIGVWAAADRLMMSKCKNMAMDQVRRALCKAGVGNQELEHVSDLGYPLDSTLARLLMDQIAYDCTTDRHSKDDSVQYEIEPTDLKRALMLTKRIVIMARAWSRSKMEGEPKPKDPAVLIGCHYHEHVKGESCYLTKTA